MLCGLLGLPLACEPLDEEEGAERKRNVGPITEITPRAALAGQRLHVTVKIGGEAPGVGSEVSFGQGIDVVGATEVPGGLDVEIEIDEEAASGPRDVTVLPDDAALLTAPAGFSVASALELTVAGGRVEQGGLVRFELTNKSSVPFAPETFTLDSAVDPGIPALSQLARGAFTGNTGSVVMLADPLARTGPLDFIGTNDPADGRSATFFARGAADVAARAPVALVSGTPIAATLGAPLATGLYVAEVAPTAGEGLILEAAARKPDGSTLEPVVHAYPASGRADDLLDIKRSIPFSPGVNAIVEATVAYPVTSPTKAFFTVFDANFAGTASSTLSFDFRTFRARIVAESASPHGVDAKQDLGAVPLGTDPIPGRIVTGALAAPGEIDAYAFTVPAGAPFRNVQVSIISDAEVDIIVDHVPNFDDDTTTFSNVERATSGTTADFPGTARFVRISASPVATKSTGAYTLGIRVVD